MCVNIVLVCSSNTNHDQGGPVAAEGEQADLKRAVREAKCDYKRKTDTHRRPSTHRGQLQPTAARTPAAMRCFEKLNRNHIMSFI